MTDFDEKKEKTEMSKTKIGIDFLKGNRQKNWRMRIGSVVGDISDKWSVVGNRWQSLFKKISDKQVNVYI